MQQNTKFIDDVVIVDFFEKRNGYLLPGKGFIEKIGDLKGKDIYELLKRE